ncbi:hypothetical protein C1H46_004732 [Malus baccata]|uniref:Uncharacterized protein n=1 Tax=Malus baccata TaxID=106549 RepID=A0A540NF29_MALBA|nr:hypothetical protein C1H46_004732 [Malus baccata]
MCDEHSSVNPDTNTQGGSNQLPDFFVVAGNNGAPVNKAPPTMDQIWETLLKISAFVNEYQKILKAFQTKNLLNFVDFERHENPKKCSRIYYANPSPNLRIWKFESHHYERTSNYDNVCEGLDDKLATMALKQGLYIHLLLS